MNVSNNPGALKAISKMGVKYSEQIRDNSKTAISIMFCGSASGVLLPPYVVYKGANVTNCGWRMGLKGAKYTATESGWFDSFCFANFFKRIALPYFKHLPGKETDVGGQPRFPHLPGGHLTVQGKQYSLRLPPFKQHSPNAAP